METTNYRKTTDYLERHSRNQKKEKKTTDYTDFTDKHEILLRKQQTDR